MPVARPTGPTRRAWLGAMALPLLGCDGVTLVQGGFQDMGHLRGHRLRQPQVAAAPDDVRRTGVVIAGGGVAGLAAARALRQRGVEDFVLLELEDSAGGNSRAGDLGGIACPLGAHYLPVPGDDAKEVQDLLEELGLRRRVAGRWAYDERHLCHSPQERLYFNGPEGAGWQDGLLPVAGVGRDTLAQYRAFAAAVQRVRQTARFALPAARAPWTALHAQLDAQTFAAWLGAQGLVDPHLRWYLDYCCRDDYGAGIATVSAWAGLHYFASRHGFSAPGGDETPAEAVLTWPEGNGWLTRRLAQPLGERLRPARVVMRIAEARHSVEVDAWNAGNGRLERWQAQQVIVALPLHVAARVVQGAPAFLRDAALAVRHAPWLVANLHLREPLVDRPGAAPSWDNVLYGSAGLGYVNARHQELDPRPGPTVLTWYQALGDLSNGRRQLLEQPWTHWRDAILAELSVPHPEIAARTTRIEITRYGHAMAVPEPGFASKIRPQAAWGLADPLSKSEQMRLTAGRLRFAHSDWSGYSVFEEAFTRGHLAGLG